MKLRFSKNKYMYSGLLIVIVISFVVFYASFYFQVWQSQNIHEVSDIPDHALFIQKFSKIGYFPVYTIWYRLVSCSKLYFICIFCTIIIKARI